MPDKDHVILVRQYRHAVNRWIWELPADKIEPGEGPDAAARLECASEIGKIPATLERVGVFSQHQATAMKRCSFTG